MDMLICSSIQVMDFKKQSSYHFLPSLIKSLIVQLIIGLITVLSLAITCTQSTTTAKFSSSIFKILPKKKISLLVLMETVIHFMLSEVSLVLLHQIHQLIFLSDNLVFVHDSRYVARVDVTSEPGIQEIQMSEYHNRLLYPGSGSYIYYAGSYSLYKVDAEGPSVEEFNINLYYLGYSYEDVTMVGM